MNKRGVTLEDLYPAVIVILLVAVALGVGIYMIDQSSQAISQELTTVNNETLTTVTEAGETVSNATECGFSNFAVSTVYANSTLLTSGNYTTDADSGTVYVTTSDYNNSDWSVTYNYRGSGGAAYCDSLDTSITGLGGLADWIAVIVVVIAAAIVLGVVISSFGRRSGV